MQPIIDALKSRGKLGAWLLMVMGIGMFVAIGFGKLDNTHLTEATGAFALGLSLLGIRAKQA